MAKRVILTLMEGSFESGFPVMLRISSDNVADGSEIQVLGKLPPAPDILEHYQNWKSAYSQILVPKSRIKAKLAQVTNFSSTELGSTLKIKLNKWLNSGFQDWQKIRDGLQLHLMQNDEIQIIIQTENTRLRQLPWHLWDVFYDYYRKAEIAIGVPEYRLGGDKTSSLTRNVKILAILGDSTNIDVQKDREILEKLPFAETTFLVEPQRQELNSLLWEQQWQIIFFAGHSFSSVEGNTGKININKNDSLSINEIKNALNRAIEKGLQLAIFNSCDGLGLAGELASLNIPQIIVMREPVPDLIAQEFLKAFLKSFSQGNSLYQAVRDAREQLQGWEKEYPFASWLPIIYHNPAAVPLTWQSLRKKSSIKTLFMKQTYKIALLCFSLILSSTFITLQSSVRNYLFNWQSSNGRFIKNRLSGKCIDVALASGQSNGVPLLLYDCLVRGKGDKNSNIGQKWTITNEGFIKNTLSGKCIDVASTNNASAIQLYDCLHEREPKNNSLTSQKWTITSEGFIKNTLSGRCIDVAGAPGKVNGARLLLYDCELSGLNRDNGTQTDQKWMIASDRD